MKKIMLLVGIFFLLMGCYNNYELTDLAIVSAISINKDGNKYTLTVQVINPNSSQNASSSYDSRFIIYKSSGFSIQEAMYNIKKKSPKKLYLVQMQALIIDDSIARNNIKDVIGFFLHNNDVREEFYVFVSKKNDLLELLTTSTQNISDHNIWNDLGNKFNNLGNVSLVTFNDLLDIYLNDNIEISLPVIKISSQFGNLNDESILKSSVTDIVLEVDSLSIFKDNKLVGYLDQNNTIGVNFLNNNIKDVVIENNYKNKGYINFKLYDSKTIIKAIVKKKSIIINVTGKASIVDNNYDIDVTDKTNLTKINNDLNHNIESLIINNLNDINTKYNSDIFGFRSILYKTNPLDFKLVKKDIDKNLSNIDITVNSNVKIIDDNYLWGGIIDVK